jgi:hypothetical protein
LLDKGGAGTHYCISLARLPVGGRDLLLYMQGMKTIIAPLAQYENFKYRGEYHGQ